MYVLPVPVYMHQEIYPRVSTEKLTLTNGCWWRRGKQWFWSRYHFTLVVHVPPIPEPMKAWEKNKSTQRNETRGWRRMDAWSLWWTQWDSSRTQLNLTSNFHHYQKGLGTRSLCVPITQGESLWPAERGGQALEESVSSPFSLWVKKNNRTSVQ